jgi:hypothetical protein
MKNYKIRFAGLVMLTLFIACDKYESTISGTITYLDTNDNVVYPASWAVVSKMQMKNDSLVTITSVRCDTNGYYSLEHSTVGTWILKGKLYVDDTVIYTGFSDEFSTSGTDKIEKDILLKIE